MGEPDSPALRAVLFEQQKELFPSSTLPSRDPPFALLEPAPALEKGFDEWAVSGGSVSRGPKAEVGGEEQAGGSDTRSPGPCRTPALQEHSAGLCPTGTGSVLPRALPQFLSLPGACLSPRGGGKAGLDPPASLLRQPLLGREPAAWATAQARGRRRVPLGLQRWALARARVVIPPCTVDGPWHCRKCQQAGPGQGSNSWRLSPILRHGDWHCPQPQGARSWASPSRIPAQPGPASQARQARAAGSSQRPQCPLQGLNDSEPEDFLNAIINPNEVYSPGHAQASPGSDSGISDEPGSDSPQPGLGGPGTFCAIICDQSDPLHSDVVSIQLGERGGGSRPSAARGGWLWGTAPCPSSGWCLVGEECSLRARGVSHPPESSMLPHGCLWGGRRR